MRWLLCVVMMLVPVLADAQQDGKTMRVHFIDVGQGAATLIEFACGAVLIDTGAEVNDDFDGVSELVEYLDDFFDRRPQLGRHLAGLYLTHAHKDHTSGVKQVLDRYSPRAAVTNGRDAPLPGQKRPSGISGQRALHRFVALAEDTEPRDDDVAFAAVRLSDFPANGALSDGAIDPVNCTGGQPRL